MAVSQPREPTQVVGRYAIYGEIASGGMATIHLGRLLGPVGFSRTVAIKRLHPQYAKDEEFVAMFLDEARLAARIQSPNVVQTMDVVSEGDTLFLVMEYIQGESFSRLWRAATQEGGQIGLGIVSAIVGGMLHGLHAVHEAVDEHGEPLHIVHRDVSPQNVIVGIDGTPRILDFGVAKAATSIQTTSQGQLKGKLQYMAPEQLTGAPAVRTLDIFAAGIVLWEALTGTRLYDGENDARIFQRVMEADAPPPSILVPDVPPALDAVVLRALMRDPADRFQTAREMALALEAAVRSAPATEVGVWCERLAESALAKRAAQVHDLESSSAVKVPPRVPVRAPQATQLDNPPTVPEAFQPVALPPMREAMPSVTEAIDTSVPNAYYQPPPPPRDPPSDPTTGFEGPDDDDAPTTAAPAYHPGKSLLLHTPPPPEAAPMPMSTGRISPAAPLPEPSSPGPVSPGQPSSSSGAWPPYDASASSQQYPGSNQSGSISRQIANAYDPSASVGYNPTASVQIVEAPPPSFAVKVLIAIATMAAVFFLFAAAMAVRGVLSRSVASRPAPTPTITQAPPPTASTGDEVAPIPTPDFTAPIASTPSAPSASASAAASASASASVKKKQQAPPWTPPKQHRPTPLSTPSCATNPFNVDANGIKTLRPECM